MEISQDGKILVLDRLDYEAHADRMESTKGHVEYEEDDRLVAFDYEIQVDGYEVYGGYIYPTEYVTTHVGVTVKNAFAYDGEDEITPVIDETELSKKKESQIR